MHPFFIYVLNVTYKYLHICLRNDLRVVLKLHAISLTCYSLINMWYLVNLQNVLFFFAYLLE